MQSPSLWLCPSCNRCINTKTLRSGSWMCFRLRSRSIQSVRSLRSSYSQLYLCTSWSHISGVEVHPLFFYIFCTRWRWVVISYPGLFTLVKKPGPMGPLGRRMYGPQSQSESFGGIKKKPFAFHAIQSQDRPVCSLVTVPNTLACPETIKYYEKFRNTFLF